MRICHYSMIFTAILCIVMIVLESFFFEQSCVMDESDDIGRAVSRAALAAAKTLDDEGGSTSATARKAALEALRVSMYASLGVPGSPLSEAKLDELVSAEFETKESNVITVYIYPYEIDGMKIYRIDASSTAMTVYKEPAHR